MSAESKRGLGAKSVSSNPRPGLQTGYTSSNLKNIRGNSTAHVAYKPTVSEDFLTAWLDFPIGKSQMLGIMLFPLRWMLWTNCSLASLSPTDPTIRERLCNSISVLGTAAGLFLVLAVAGLLEPPEATTDADRLAVDVFGVLMFIASICLTLYIGISLTGVYPLMQSLRDDVTFDTFEYFKQNWGGFELYFFNAGIQLLLFAYLAASVVLYSWYAVWTMIGSMFVLYSICVFLATRSFIALDPITSMHLGLSNDPKVAHRAELLSRYYLNNIPNSFLSDLIEEKQVESEGNDHVHREKPVPQQQHQERGANPQRAAERQGHTLLRRSMELSASQRDRSPFASRPTHSVEQPATDAEIDCQASAPVTVLPPSECFITLGLHDIFSGPDFRLAKAEVPRHIAESAYAVLMDGGCTSVEALFCFLDSNKQFLGPCDCEKIRQGSIPAPQHPPCFFMKVEARSQGPKRKKSSIAPLQAYSSASTTSFPSSPPSLFDQGHCPNCPQRRAGCWQDALFKLLGEKVSVFYCFKIITVLKPYLR